MQINISSAIATAIEDGIEVADKDLFRKVHACRALQYFYSY